MRPRPPAPLRSPCSPRRCRHSHTSPAHTHTHPPRWPPRLVSLARYYLKEPFGGRGRQKFYRFLLSECPPAGVSARRTDPTAAAAPSAARSAGKRSPLLLTLLLFPPSMPRAGWERSAAGKVHLRDPDPQPGRRAPQPRRGALLPQDAAAAMGPESCAQTRRAPPHRLRSLTFTWATASSGARFSRSGFLTGSTTTRCVPGRPGRARPVLWLLCFSFFFLLFSLSPFPPPPPPPFPSLAAPVSPPPPRLPFPVVFQPLASLHSAAGGTQDGDHHPRVPDVAEPARDGSVLPLRSNCAATARVACASSAALPRQRSPAAPYPLPLLTPDTP